MYQLNYHSISSNTLDIEDINDILTKANTINESKNISGCLIYHNNNFVQILEGEKNEVLEVYAKIKNDARHHTVNLLWENEVNDRHFEDWNMAFYHPKENNMKQFVDNFLLLSSVSVRSSGTLLSFWASVRKIFDETHRQL